MKEQDRIEQQNIGGDHAGTISFEPTADETGLNIIDPIERHRYSLATPTRVSPTPINSDTFLFPVDASVSVTTKSITLPTVVAVYVRDASGRMLTEAEHFATEEFPEDTYSLEICAPIKCYLRVNSQVSISANATQTQISFETPTDVFVGARSHHDHPAATVTTTTDPKDMMAAVSTFGSALKTTSVERSYPTLRGHPPTIERGDELQIPDCLEVPETGVRIEVPPDYESIYVVTPLVYYLGAQLEPGSEPRIVTETGFEYTLGATRGFEADVERVLKQVFFLDCITRTEGYYQVDLHEREEIEQVVDLDFSTLYDKSLPEQLEAYLEVPFDVIEDQIPEWKQTTHVRPTADSIDFLPFVVDDLAIIRTPVSNTVSESTVQTSAVSEFLRAESGEFTRSTSQSESLDSSYIQPENTDSLEQTWIGDGTPVGASKATTDAFEHRLDRTPTDGDIDITVICNDMEMHAERDVVEESYGERAKLPFDVSVKRDLTTEELRETLASEQDFLHYIGHIDEEGFNCADGKLDATTLETVAVDAFLLNACQSYKQGMHLLEAGSIGGVVTLSEVINSGAVRIGRAMARLLNRGFPLQAALDIARDESIVGGQYIVVGDGGLAIAQAESGTPNMCEIEKVGDNYRVHLSTYPTDQRGLGSMVIPHLAEVENFFLSSGEIEPFDLSRSELDEFLQLEDIPVKVDGELKWSSQLSVSEI
ncbi:CHAT domain-containing protein [Halorussus salinisoli]|uniref:hypothetical protein n=1 Tax=Halorussus salinisoli TaxID=2558242 RepID=UPI002A90B73B|nr:hypothetical protein [Halorussus salinisoli]